MSPSFSTARVLITLAICAHVCAAERNRGLRPSRSERPKRLSDPVNSMATVPPTFSSGFSRSSVEPIFFPGPTQGLPRKSSNRNEIPLSFFRDLYKERDIERVLAKFSPGARIGVTAGGTKIIQQGSVGVDVVSIPSATTTQSPVVAGLWNPRHSAALRHDALSSDLRRSFRIFDEETEDQTVAPVAFSSFARKITSKHRFIENSSKSRTQSLGHAVCEPENRTVRVQLPAFKHHSNVRLYPECVRVPRCGGCCGHPALECEPTAELLLDVMVFVIHYNHSSNTEIKSTEKVKIASHSACDCGCKVKAMHCNPSLHYYNRDECKCICRNEDEEDMCLGMDNRIWNHETCSCDCPSTDCNSGLEVDPRTCNCVQRGGRIKHHTRPRTSPTDSPVVHFGK